MVKTTTNINNNNSTFIRNSFSDSSLGGASSTTCVSREELRRRRRRTSTLPATRLLMVAYRDSQSSLRSWILWFISRRATSTSNRACSTKARDHQETLRTVRCSVLTCASCCERGYASPSEIGGWHLSGWHLCVRGPARECNGLLQSRK